MTHRDSLGIEQVIRPGEVNWMTSGRGISHSERFDGMRDHGRATCTDCRPGWRCPRRMRKTSRRSNTTAAGNSKQSTAPGVRARLIAGIRVRRDEWSAHAFAAVLRAPGDWSPDLLSSCPPGISERAAYVVSGSVDAAGRRSTTRPWSVARSGAALSFRACESSTVMLLGGEPVGARHVWWNFVSSRKERIEQAKRDWSEGRIPLPAADADEWIPLPEGL